ncbi:MAG: hypothetical protein U0821_17615 [Chloroflexota bacterium]
MSSIRRERTTLPASRRQAMSVLRARCERIAELAQSNLASINNLHGTPLPYESVEELAREAIVGIMAAADFATNIGLIDGLDYAALVRFAYGREASPYWSGRTTGVRADSQRLETQLAVGPDARIVSRTAVAERISQIYEDIPHLAAFPLSSVNRGREAGDRHPSIAHYVRALRARAETSTRFAVDMGLLGAADHERIVRYLCARHPRLVADRWFSGDSRTR